MARSSSKHRWPCTINLLPKLHVDLFVTESCDTYISAYLWTWPLLITCYIEKISIYNTKEIHPIKIGKIQNKEKRK